MLHACVRRFDVTGAAQIFFGTKHGLRFFINCVFQKKQTTTRTLASFFLLYIL